MSIMQSLFSSLSKTFTFVGSSTVNDTPNISLPSGSQVGDFAILFDVATSGIIFLIDPSTVIPTNWTSFVNANDSNSRIIGSYSKLTSVDSVTGMTFPTLGLGGGSSKTIIVFRPNFEISQISYTANVQISDSTLSSQSITMSAAQSPIISAAQWSSSSTTPNRTVTGITMNEISNSPNQYVRYLIYNYNQIPANGTVSTTTSASNNALASVYFTFT